jgi:hypothetical protein
MADRGEKNEKGENAGGESTSEDNYGVRVEEPEESPESKTEGSGKSERQDPSPTHTANINHDEHTERRMDTILNGSVATARDNIPLAEGGIPVVRLRKTMAASVGLEVSDNQKRKKAAALAARVTRILSLSKDSSEPRKQGCSE